MKKKFLALFLAVNLVLISGCNEAPASADSSVEEITSVEEISELEVSESETQTSISEIDGSASEEELKEDSILSDVSFNDVSSNNASEDKEAKNETGDKENTQPYVEPVINKYEASVDMYIKVSNCNIRSRASMDSDAIIAKKQINDVVQVIGITEDKEWSVLSFETENGYAFVKSFALSETEIDLTANTNTTTNASSITSTSASIKPSKIEKVHVTIPGMAGSYTFAYMCDLHIITDNPNEVAASDTLTTAVNSFCYNGVKSIDAWPRWVNYLNGSNVNAVLLGGDMIHFCSPTTASVMRNGLNSLNKPFIYETANHDLAYSIDGITILDTSGAHSTLGGENSFQYFEYPEFYILMVDITAGDISDGAMATISSIWSSGKKVILMSHVPIKSVVDPSLEAFRAQQNDGTLWGSGEHWEGGANAQTFLSMVYADNSPVVQVLSGHLHGSWDGYISNTCKQHVFSPAVDGCIGQITVSGN